MKAIRLWLLKRRAAALLMRKNTLRYRYNCGELLAEHISPEIAEINRDLSALWVKIRKLDPGCPDINFE